MPLFSTTVKVWNTKKPGDRMRQAYGDVYLLNTNRIIELTEVGADDTQFWYADDPDDARDSPGFVECTSSKAYIEAIHNDEPDSKVAFLDIFPAFDRTETAVETGIEWDDIAYIWQSFRDVAYGTSHMVYYTKAWERILCIIDHTPAEVLTLMEAAV